MLRMSPEDYRKHQERVGREQMKRDGGQPTPEKEKPVKRPKHGNTKVLIGDLKFDSKREAARWQELLVLKRAGKISSLERQNVFELAPSVILDGRKKPPLRYIADFTYIENGFIVIEDAKSPHLRVDPVYRIKKHLMAVRGLFINDV